MENVSTLQEYLIKVKNTILDVKRKLSYSEYIDDSVQACSNSSALAMELLQSCTKQTWHFNIFAQEHHFMF